MFRAAAAFLGLRAVPFVGEEVLQRGEEEGAELAALGGEAFEVVLLQKAGEERLHEILRVLLRLPLPAHEGVERIPIRLAQLGQRPFGVRRRFAPGRQHHGPARGDEDVARVGGGGRIGSGASHGYGAALELTTSR